MVREGGGEKGKDMPSSAPSRAVWERERGSSESEITSSRLAIIQVFTHTNDPHRKGKESLRCLTGTAASKNWFSNAADSRRRVSGSPLHEKLTRNKRNRMQEWQGMWNEMRGRKKKKKNW